ncbi:MAG TPA: ATP-binding cassette domain-containing protein [bacterium]|nr:ATP-binding cassette domain-containing protein [bacterium]
MSAAVEIRQLVRRFGDLVAVAELDLTVESGVLFGLLGSNGAGKTTVLRVLTTLLPPTSGNASVAGFDVVARPREVRRRIGYVPQLVSADGTLTARENLVLSAKLHGLPRTLREERIEDAFSTMGLANAADELVRTFSGGMIRRLEIAQAMLHRPAVLFLDEPTVGLDPTARHAVWDRLRDLQARLATTIVLTTHDMQEADALCARIAILHRGKIVADGAPAALKTQVKPDATLDDVFAHFTGGSVEAGGDYRDIARTRRTAERLG